ncbi:hypothetical protein M9Y10_006749 [Tritrichomonas musculus]|uniref:F5/8 type C domain-containing protein n=1 Tax=Tritrichomonas musculus TaxID=1915356 RepID=A0ABR2JGT2_9EUKA
MSGNSIKLSSDGIKNIVPNACQEDNEFRFIFGQKVIKMNPIYADFVSPAASKLHTSDPTISSIYFKDCKFGKSKSQFQIEQIMSEDMVSLLKQISFGLPIQMNEEQTFKMRIISVLLQNNELFTMINENLKNEINETNLDFYLQDLLFYYEQNRTQLHSYNYQNIIDYIASNFHSIEQEKLLQLPKPILYSIITNKNLQLENEDSLLTFIQKIFINDEEEAEDEKENQDSEENINITSFYEAIDFLSLSESKFQEFVENFESTKMTKLLWSKLYPCFYINYSQKNEQQKKNRYFRKERYSLKDHHIDFDGDESHGFQGIIHQLTEETGGNVSENGTVKVTSSPTNGNDVVSKYAVDFDDIYHYFQSKNEPNSWLKYDFLDSSVRPTFYTIRTRPEGGKGDNHPKNWVIEGSNTDNDDDWKILDERNNVTVLDDSNVAHTFEIQTELNPNERFRYLRIRETGPNTQKGNYYFLTLSALEYFGILYSK